MASLKDILENTFVTKVAYTVAASAIIGGGGVVLNNQSRIAVLENTNTTLEHRIEMTGAALDKRLDRIEGKVDMLLERPSK